MTSDRIRKFFVIGFVMMFFAYLFGPLLLMSVSAFNSSAFPRVSPFECFTVEWFSVLAQDKTLMEGLRNSLIIGFGVVLIAVPMGLAGALMLKARWPFHVVKRGRLGSPSLRRSSASGWLPKSIVALPTMKVTRLE